MRREAREMYLERVNRVLDFAYDHLEQPLTLPRLATVGDFSPFHFHRVFKAVTGETLAEFIKRARLEKAVYLLKHGGDRTLTEVAFEVGFNSSTDFSRSFKQRYGFAPRDLTPERLRASPALQQALQGRSHPELEQRTPGNPDGFAARVVEHPARRVAYVRIQDPYTQGNLVAGFERLMEFVRRRSLETGQLIGMSRDDPEITPLDKARYDFAVDLRGRPDVGPDGAVGVTTLPGGKFGVLAVAGDLAKVARAWNYMFEDWLPSSGYEPTHDPGMEVFVQSPAELGWETWDLEGWLPVRPARGQLSPRGGR